MGTWSHTHRLVSCTAAVRNNTAVACDCRRGRRRAYTLVLLCAGVAASQDQVRRTIGVRATQKLSVTGTTRTLTLIVC